MSRKRNEKVITVNTREYDSLVASIENIQGVHVKKTRTGIQVYITKQHSNSIQWGAWKNRKSIYNGDLVSVFPKGKKEQEEQRGTQFSAIIAK